MNDFSEQYKEETENDSFECFDGIQYAPSIEYVNWLEEKLTIAQQSLSGSEQSPSPKSDFKCRHCNTEWNHSDMIGTRKCPNCQKSDF